ncbi:MAG: S10 family peptidase [Phycisphaerales bacterium JB064]
MNFKIPDPWLVLATAILGFAGMALAQEAEPEAPASKATFQRYPDAPSVTRHSVEINGQAIHYTATADTITLVNDKGEPTANLFYIAYRKIEGGADSAKFPEPTDRPITFSFNGGPGSSSVWLHLGIFGPRRVQYEDEVGHPGPPPYTVIPNAFSLLDKSDFVFIDPVSTGYSRAEEGTSEKQFHGLESDLDSVADFIRMYLTREQRWSSPRIIAGESYGTTRAAGLAQRLHDRHGISVSGVVLISPVLEFQTIRFGEGNDLPYAMFLPSYTAIAHYHEALPEKWQSKPVEDAIAEARRFALDQYLPALLKGASLPEAERTRVRTTLSELTGLSTQYLENSGLRISQPRFSKELLRHRNQTVGRLDARFLGIDADHAGDSYEYDASYEAIRSNYTEAMNAYVRGELGYQSDLPYEILTSVWPWDYGGAGRDRYVTVADRLRDAMHRQPHARVFVAMGHHDLATPFFAAETTLNRMRLDPSYRDRIDTAYYPAGHMMYVHQPSLERLKADLDAFYEALP